MIKKTRLATGLALTMLITFGCAKKRDAAFPEETGNQVFAISDFGTLDPNGGVNVQTQAHGRDLTDAEKARALYAQGVTPVVTESATVNSRLRFMFDDLEVLEQAGTPLHIVFGVTPDFVTAFKVVPPNGKLNPLERGLAISFEQAAAELNLPRTVDPAQKNLLAKQIRDSRIQRGREFAAGKVTAGALVPLFKFKVEAFGTVSRKKNEMKEDTAVLELKKTKWNEATHVQVKNESAGRVMFLPSATKKDEQEQVFFAAAIENGGQPRSVQSLKDIFGITTSLDADKMVVLKLNEKDSALEIRDTDTSKTDPLATVAISFVNPQVGAPPWQGPTLGKELEMTKCKRTQTDLVQIPKGDAKAFEPKKADAANPAAAAPAATPAT